MTRVLQDARQGLQLGMFSMRAMASFQDTWSQVRPQSLLVISLVVRSFFSEKLRAGAVAAIPVRRQAGFVGRRV